MRLLFLSLNYPVPATNGVKMRAWALLRTLAAEGHEITVLSFAAPGEANGVGTLREICRKVEVVPFALGSAATAGDFPRRFRALFSKLPYSVARFRSPAMQERIGVWLRSGALDAVVAETPYLLVNLPASPGLPLILDNHNLEHVLLERYMIQERNPARRAYAWTEWRKLRSWERRANTRANLALVCSKHDQKQLEKLAPGVQSTVVPNAIDVESYEPRPQSDGPTLLYCGGMDWYPNRDAVQFFASEILPSVRRAVPGVRFVVAGRNPSESFTRRVARSGGVEFTGTVSDMRPWIARASVCVVPLRVASGTRLKILEAGAMAKGVVSTRIGAEGLEFEDGKEILLADSSGEFARATVALLEDESRRRKMGQAARRRVERQYSLAALRPAVHDALASLSPKAAFTARETSAHVACDLVA